jgi:dihydropteroate synthase
MGFALRPRFEWRLRTRSLALGERTLVMAVVNLTPDSFSGDGLAARGVETSVGAALAAIDAGADIVDLGAESTRPDAVALTAQKEQARLLPVLEAVRRERPEAVLSVDTYHASTALAAAQAGAEILNDVSGLTWDGGMADAVAKTGCGLVLMHTHGRSSEWRTQARLGTEKVVATVLDGLREQLDFAQAAGIERDRIVLDPGFGFGKIGQENFALLAGFARLGELGFPLLAGLSRKGFLGEAVRRMQSEVLPLPEARRTATITANVAAVLAGAHIVRVHEVQAAREAVAVADAVLEFA